MTDLCAIYPYSFGTKQKSKLNNYNLQFMPKRYRKKENNLILEIVTNSSWIELLFYSLLIALFGFVIFPILFLSSHILKLFLPVINFASGIIIFIFLIASLCKLIASSIAKKPPSDVSYIFNNEVKPTKISKYNNDKLEPDIHEEIETAEWSLELLKSLDWKRFEDLCSAYFDEKKIKNNQTSLGADGGIDILLFENSFSTPTALVQCKRHTGVIGVTLIREFVGVMHHEKINRGYFFTTGTFNTAAIDFAASNNLKLIDGAAFLSLIKRLPEESKNNLLYLTTDGDYKTPTCVKCGTKMILRTGKQKKFWGCSNFPKCRSKLAHLNN